MNDKIINLGNLFCYLLLIVFVVDFVTRDCLSPLEILHLQRALGLSQRMWYEICENWFKFYNNYLYRKSIICKGPLLISAGLNIDQTFDAIFE